MGSNQSTSSRLFLSAVATSVTGAEKVVCPLILVVVVAASGCMLTRPGASTAPVVFNSPPDLPQLISAVNENTDKVRQLHSDSVRLSVPGQLGSLRATVDFDRMTGPDSPGRFRLFGNALGTRQLDLGSNDDRYWMWVKQNQPPTVYWGRHSQFYQSAAQEFLPMPPAWLIDALGVVHLDPNGKHDGPYASQSPGQLQIRTKIPTPRGELLRVLDIDQQRALIMQQQIFDPRGQLLAIANSSDFRLNSGTGVALPHTIKVNLPPAGLSFNFAVDSYTVNDPVADPDTHWAVPEIPNHRYLDLANPNDMRGVQLLGSAPPDFYDRAQVTTQPATAEETPRAAWRRFPPFSVFR